MITYACNACDGESSCEHTTADESHNEPRVCPCGYIAKWEVCRW